VTLKNSQAIQQLKHRFSFMKVEAHKDRKMSLLYIVGGMIGIFAQTEFYLYDRFSTNRFDERFTPKQLEMEHFKFKNYIFVQI